MKKNHTCSGYDFYTTNPQPHCIHISPMGTFSSPDPYYNTHTVIAVAPDSTYLDSTFTWYLTVKNRFGLRDSLQISTRVSPYVKGLSSFIVTRPDTLALIVEPHP